jgi:hypothetical protein
MFGELVGACSIAPCSGFKTRTVQLRIQDNPVLGSQ